MTFLINIGDGFVIRPHIHPDGSLIMPLLTPKLQLERRKFSKFPLLQNRYFDPQLYRAGMDPIQSPSYCANLATYSWFGAKDFGTYDSKKYKQQAWMQYVQQNIHTVWRRNPIDPKKEPKLVEEVVRDCIDFQIRIGCKAIILPSPLTHDSNTDYAREIFWLDAAVDYLKHLEDLDIPVFATIALRDTCLNFTDPPDNSLIEMVLDTVSAREVDGAYLVVEQGSENELAKNISNIRVLWSALHMAHLLKHDSGKSVGVNFFGTFGLALMAAGADFWASSWYKSRYRLRVADQIAGGPAYPSCWSNVALIDISLDKDFEALWKAGLILGRIERTEASKSLLDGLAQGKPVKQIPAWAFTPNNNTAAIDHFLESVSNSDRQHSRYSGIGRIEYVENGWLVPAAEECKRIQQVLGRKAKTHTEHVYAWLEAFRLFRRDQNL